MTAGKNVFRNDSYVRIALAVGLTGAAFLQGSWAIAVIAVALVYSGITRFCPLYHLLGINRRFSLKNHYLSQLPIYNKQAVFIFDAEGQILFRNDSARANFPMVEKLQHFGTLDAATLIARDTSKTTTFEEAEKIYQIALRGVSRDRFLLAYANDVTRIAELNDEIEETQREVIYAMGQIGETRSQETGNHVKRVAHYSELLAQLYGLDFEACERLKIASPMHDIGKVGIPDAILNAPRKLTAEEFEVMKTHATLGYEMLRHSGKPILQAAAIVAHEHHEKYDGSGYPRGLAAEEIHIYGRITAVADVFDALGSDRIYKKAWPLEEVLTLMRRESGKQFDPTLIDLFMDNLEHFLAIRERYRD